MEGSAFEKFKKLMKRAANNITIEPCFFLFAMNYHFQCRNLQRHAFCQIDGCNPVLHFYLVDDCEGSLSSQVCISYLSAMQLMQCFIAAHHTSPLHSEPVMMG